MSDEFTGNDQPHSPPSLSRNSLGSRALVIRDSDAIRNGIRGLLREVTMSRLVVRLPEPVPEGEQIKLRLRNFVQRFRKEARGVVRNAFLDVDRPEEFIVEIELYTRLTPLEVSLLRMGIRDDSQPRRTRWV